ncbi:hypothetical protein ACPPVO_47640 [Dactylosporangium sp. McL0621]
MWARRDGVVRTWLDALGHEGLILSIYPRHGGFPESRPVGAAHGATGVEG